MTTPSAEPVLRLHSVGHGIVALLELTAGWGTGARALAAHGAVAFACALVSAGGWLAVRVGRSQGNAEAQANAEALSRALMGIVTACGGAVVAWNVAAAGPRAIEATALWTALLVGGASALITGGLAVHARGWGKRAKSTSLVAVGRTAFLSLLGSGFVLIGLLGVRTEIDWAGGASAFGVAFLMVVIGWRLFGSGMNVLMDRVSDPNLRARIEATATAIDGVKAVQHLNLHPLGAHYRAELRIGVEGDLTVAQGTRLARRVEAALEQDHEEIGAVAVAVEPWIPEGSAWG